MTEATDAAILAHLGYLSAEIAEIRKETRSVPGIEEHLRTLNGSVARHESAIAANRRAIETVADQLDGFELKDKIARAEARGASDERAKWKRIIRYVTRDGIVLKWGMAFIFGVLGFDAVKGWIG